MFKVYTNIVLINTCRQAFFCYQDLVVNRFRAVVKAMSDARYCVEYATTGRSGCKKCKTNIVKGSCRIGKIATNPFRQELKLTRSINRSL